MKGGEKLNAVEERKQFLTSRLIKMGVKVHTQDLATLEHLNIIAMCRRARKINNS